jgi:hypothetical protein
LNENFLLFYTLFDDSFDFVRFEILFDSFYGFLVWFYCYGHETLESSEHLLHRRLLNGGEVAFVALSPVLKKKRSFFESFE